MADPVPSRTFLNLPLSKQERIILEAVKEFGEKGYRSASINSMVKELGIAKGSIYQYFGDKSGLFLHVFACSMEKVKQYLKDVRARTAERPLSERLKETLGAGVRFIEEHPLFYRLYVTFLNDDAMPMRGELLTALRSHSMEYLVSLLRQAEASGELLPGTDLEKAAFIVDAVMDRFLLSRTSPHAACSTGIYSADRPAVDLWIDQIVTMICRGITDDRT
jgi:AcrR family transcriptional regulator